MVKRITSWTITLFHLKSHYYGNHLLPRCKGLLWLSLHGNTISSSYSALAEMHYGIWAKVKLIHLASPEGLLNKRHTLQYKKYWTDALLLLTLGTHALQGYSSCVCVCPVWFFQTVTNRPGRPTDCLSTTIAWFERLGFRKTASLRRYRIRVAAVLAHWSAVLLAPAGAPSVYPFTWHCSQPSGVFVMGFAIVFGTML